MRLSSLIGPKQKCHWCNPARCTHNFEKRYFLTRYDQKTQIVPACVAEGLLYLYSKGNRFESRIPSTTPAKVSLCPFSIQIGKRQDCISVGYYHFLQITFHFMLHRSSHYSSLQILSHRQCCKLKHKKNNVKTKDLTWHSACFWSINYEYIYRF